MRILAIAAFAALTINASQAAPVITCDLHGCSDSQIQTGAQRANRGSGKRSSGQQEITHRQASYEVQIIPNPPCGLSRRFCGAGASWRIFGECRRDLYKAAAWFRFPRSSPAPMTVAVTRSHVFVLEHHIDGQMWSVSDYNSGGHKSRRHVRSIAGTVIVNPRGMHASNSGIIK